ncbi:MAG: endoribonuclease YbeY [Gemmatales bacterium]|nr:MAG: endoribonuclease YbeY [Gemmatales bacterium]
MIRLAIAVNVKNPKVDRRLMRRCARTVLRGEGITEADISLAFVDNETIRRVHEEFLHIDTPTDVLSFDLGKEGNVLTGEIIVGAEVADAEAKRLGHGVQEELALYVIHGVLHLCGYDDRTKRDAKKMREKEKTYLRLLGLSLIAPDA